MLTNALRSNFFNLGNFSSLYSLIFHAGNETEYNKHKSLRLTEHIGFKTQALTLIALQRPLAQGNCWFSSAVFNQHCKLSLRQTGEAALHLYPGSLGYKYNTVSILKDCICLYAAGSNYKQANLLWKMVWPSLWWKSDDGSSSGGKIMFPFRVQRGGPPLFKGLPNLTASLLLCCGEYQSNLLLEGANFLVLLNYWRIFRSIRSWTHRKVVAKLHGHVLHQVSLVHLSLIFLCSRQVAVKSLKIWTCIFLLGTMIPTCHRLWSCRVDFKMNILDYPAMELNVNMAIKCKCLG